MSEVGCWMNIPEYFQYRVSNFYFWVIGFRVFVLSHHLQLPTPDIGLPSLLPPQTLDFLESPGMVMFFVQIKINKTHGNHEYAAD